jgi:hypothetical protein
MAKHGKALALHGIAWQAMARPGTELREATGSHGKPHGLPIDGPTQSTWIAESPYDTQMLSPVCGLQDQKIQQEKKLFPFGSKEADDLDDIYKDQTSRVRRYLSRLLLLRPPCGCRSEHAKAEDVL